MNRDAADAAAVARKLLDDAHISNQDRIKFLSAIQTFLTGNSPTLEPAFRPRDFVHWQKSLVALSTFVQAIGDPRALHAGDDDTDSDGDREITVQLTDKEYEIWKQIRDERGPPHPISLSGGDGQISSEFHIDEVLSDVS
jgi:hypothetical protein